MCFLKEKLKLLTAKSNKGNRAFKVSDVTPGARQSEGFLGPDCEFLAAFTASVKVEKLHATIAVQWFVVWLLFFRHAGHFTFGEQLRDA